MVPVGMWLVITALEDGHFIAYKFFRKRWLIKEEVL